MRQILLLILWLTLFLSACSNRVSDDTTAEKTDTISLVMRISQQSRLYTAEYHIHKIVTHDDLLHVKGNILGVKYNHNFQIGDRKIAIPIDVTMKSYIDFTNFNEQNIEISGDYIHIILPDARVVITSSKVDYTHMQQFTSVFRQKYSDAEKSQITKQGVESIISKIPEIGITNTARECAAQMLIPLLANMGYSQDHIVITFRDDWDKTRIQDIYDNEGSNQNICQQ